MGLRRKIGGRAPPEMGAPPPRNQILATPLVLSQDAIRCSQKPQSMSQLNSRNLRKEPSVQLKEETVSTNKQRQTKTRTHRGVCSRRRAPGDCHASTAMRNPETVVVRTRNAAPAMPPPPPRLPGNSDGSHLESGRFRGGGSWWGGGWFRPSKGG